MRNKILGLLAIGLIACAGFVSPAFAADVSDTLDLQVEVMNECVIDVQDFSTQITGWSNEVNNVNAGNVTVACNLGTTYSIAIDANGQHFGLGAGDGGDSRRSLADGEGEFLSYDIFQDAAMTIPWADGAFTVAGVGTGSFQQYPYHLSFYAPNLVTNGVYNDADPVTLTYNE